MKMKIRLAHLRIMAIKPFLVFLFCCLSASVNAQSWDFITWHKFSASGELIKDLKLSVEQQVRLNENSTGLDETFTEVGLGYVLPKGFDISAAYRLAWDQNDDRSLSATHRYNTDLSYSKKIWKFGAKLRARFQYRPSDAYFNERLKPDDSPVFFRFKLGFYYRKLKKWTPGIEFETFVRMEDPNNLGAKKFRYRVFLDYDLPKRQELGLFYMIQTDNFGKTPEFASIIGLNYSYEWKRPKKKKKKKDK